MSNIANKAGNLILIGFMGTGKTSVGKRAARSLGYRFVDTDEQIVSQEGQEIANIFAERGEDVFRQIEAATLDQCCKGEGQVISTGGGIVTRKANRDLLRLGGWVIWLQASPESVYERVRRNTDRPLLATQDPQKTISDLMAARAQYYDQCADLVISTDELSLEETIYGVVETARFWQGEGGLP